MSGGNGDKCNAKEAAEAVALLHWQAMMRGLSMAT
jgi:hypothetical protein